MDRFFNNMPFVFVATAVRRANTKGDTVEQDLATCKRIHVRVPNNRDFPLTQREGDEVWPSRATTDRFDFKNASVDNIT